MSVGDKVSQGTWCPNSRKQLEEMSAVAVRQKACLDLYSLTLEKFLWTSDTRAKQQLLRDCRLVCSLHGCTSLNHLILFE